MSNFRNGLLGHGDKQNFENVLYEEDTQLDYEDGNLIIDDEDIQQLPSTSKQTVAVWPTEDKSNAASSAKRPIPSRGQQQLWETAMPPAVSPVARPVVKRRRIEELYVSKKNNEEVKNVSMSNLWMSICSDIAERQNENPREISRFRINKSSLFDNFYNMTMEDFGAALLIKETHENWSDIEASLNAIKLEISKMSNKEDIPYENKNIAPFDSQCEIDKLEIYNNLDENIHYFLCALFNLTNLSGIEFFQDSPFSAS